MSSDGSANGVNKAPTVMEANFMFTVLENHEGPLKINWNGVATSMGLKNGSTASVRFGQIKRKLGWSAGAGTNRNISHRVTKSGAPAKPHSIKGRKPATKKEGKGAKTKPRSANAKVASYKINDGTEDNEKGDEASAKEKKKVVDLMAGSDDDVEEEEEESFEAKVNRGDYDEDHDGELYDCAIEQLKHEMQDRQLQNIVEEQQEEYDAYDPDAVFEDAEDDVQPANGVKPDVGSERLLYVPKYR